MLKKTVYVISGQTATGKTELAIALAKKTNGVIISADARQAYKLLDVISGKDIEKSKFVYVTTYNEFAIGYYTIKGIQIWLYDMVDPHMYLSAYDWAVCAKKLIQQFIKEDIVPIVVGGSWFYISCLLYGIQSQSEPNFALRAKLGEKSVEELQIILQEKNMNRWEVMNNSDRNNPRRLMREIEKNSQSITKNTPLRGIVDDYSVRGSIFLYENTQLLQNRIYARVVSRITKGAFEEVDLLMRMGYTNTDPGLQTIGYQQLINYHNNECTQEEAVVLWERKELQYAKRQKTFMKKNTQLIHINPEGKTLDELLTVLY